MNLIDFLELVVVSQEVKLLPLQRAISVCVSLGKKVGRIFQVIAAVEEPRALKLEPRQPLTLVHVQPRKVMHLHLTKEASRRLVEILCTRTPLVSARAWFLLPVSSGNTPRKL